METFELIGAGFLILFLAALVFGHRPVTGR
jgi:hypothetical protein